MNSKPNVLLVFMDDMGYGDMGCFGSSAIKTPNMDAIARDGIRFTAMYSASAVCSPSRTALMTGRQPQRVGIERVLFPNDTNGIPDGQRTVADDLKAAGYRTVMAGKWHMGCLPKHYPTRHGFNHFLGLLYSNDMSPLGLYSNETVVEEPADQAQLTRRYTDEIISFIEQEPDKPFFAYLAHTMPHIPLHVEKAFRNTSAAGTYGDTIECIDFHLGRILEKLAALGLAENTLVCVTSDNGPWYQGSTGGLRGRKFQTYEGGIRMPFVARLPGWIAAGSVCDEPASLMDLRPTFGCLAGRRAPDDTLDGIDIGAAFQGKPMPERDALYFYNGYDISAMRSGKWKLIRSVGNTNAEEPQLFDLEADREENYNVANLHPEVVKDMCARMQRFDESVQADRPPEDA